MSRPPHLSLQDRDKESMARNIHTIVWIVVWLADRQVPPTVVRPMMTFPLVLRRGLDLRAAIMNVWISSLERDEQNSSVSYYDKGSLLGGILNMWIIQKTAGAKCLDDVFKLLYTSYLIIFTAVPYA